MLSTVMRMSVVLLALLLTPSLTNGQEWLFERSVDPMTDVDQSFIFASAQPGGDNELALGVKCLSSEPRLILMHGYMGGNRAGQVLVELRIDGGDVITQRWGLADSKRGSFAPRSEQASTIARFKAGSTVVVRVTDPLDGERKVDTFTLSGFTSLYDQLPCT